ncbi:MAG: alpha/beta hydrolase [Candidatus Krumholzibacteria bacterium]|nr:alpha/beta hydrolase [Candidatus Krumholzibacteria bacterium]
MKNPGAAIILIMVLILTSGINAYAAEAVDIQDELDGVPYRIQIPGNWNKGLVMYAHGYKMPGRPWSPMSDNIGQVFIDRGFALAQSGYSRQGWALEQAVGETESLRKYFQKQYGRADSTFITGHSMGGLITLATIEIYPEAYDGAMPMCGPLAPAMFFFKDRIFDMVVSFEAIFGDNIPVEYQPLMEAAILPRAAVQQALDARPGMATKYALHWGIKEKDVAGTIAMNQFLLKELEERAGGNPFDNRGTIYMGFGQIDGLNDKVLRYDADPGAVDYIRKHYTATGEIEDPVLALHTSYDSGVPTCVPCYYAKMSALKDNADLFVQLYVEAEGHCNFTAGQTGKVFDMLRGWVATGQKPEAGLLQ